jgi:hypothetical protein
VIDKVFEASTVTKDVASVAKEIQFSDKLRNMGGADILVLPAAGPVLSVRLDDPVQTSKTVYPVRRQPYNRESRNDSRRHHVGNEHRGKYKRC